MYATNAYLGLRCRLCNSASSPLISCSPWIAVHQWKIAGHFSTTAADKTFGNGRRKVHCEVTLRISQNCAIKTFQEVISTVSQHVRWWLMTLRREKQKTKTFHSWFMRKSFSLSPHFSATQSPTDYFQFSRTRFSFSGRLRFAFSWRIFWRVEDEGCLWVVHVGLWGFIGIDCLIIGQQAWTIKKPRK